MPEYRFSGRGSVKGRERYLEAVRQAYQKDYEALALFFVEAIERRRKCGLGGGSIAPSNTHDWRVSASIRRRKFRLFLRKGFVLINEAMVREYQLHPFGLQALFGLCALHILYNPASSFDF